MSRAAGAGRAPARGLAGCLQGCWPLALAMGLLAALPAYGAQAAAIDTPLTAVPGDAGRGRSLVANRSLSLCLLCHSGPLPEQSHQGNLAPDLAGAGTRYTAAQLRLRLVDSRLVNPQSIMPPYYVKDGLNRVGSAWQGRTILDAQQIEDVIAYLLSLR